MDRLASPSSEVFHKDLGAASSDGRRFWRSFDELAQSPEFIERLHREFPNFASEWLADVDDDAKQVSGLSRRNFITLMGASLAMMGLTGCRTRPPTQKIVPYVNQPEQLVLGKPLYFATALNVNGAAQGVLVESHEGRPTKIEGNPQHPATQGASNVYTQAAILSLYDPDRSQVVTNAGVVSTWDNFLSEMTPRLASLERAQGRGLRILSEPIVSPTLAEQHDALRKKFPEARWHFHSPTYAANKHAGARLAFGESLNTVYALNAADVIVALDSDFLADEPGSIRYARHFIDGRRVRTNEQKLGEQKSGEQKSGEAKAGEPKSGERPVMNRLYAIESTHTITGASADHRLPLAPDQIGPFAAALARAVGVSNVPNSEPPAGATPAFVNAIADDLRAAGKRALVICGEYQPPAVHAICHAINQRLGAIGTSVYFTSPIEHGNPDDPANSIEQLVADMNAGQVDTLLIVGGNPVYNAPAVLNFTAAMNRVPFRVRLGMYDDETSYQCHWHIPQTHELEQWGDLRAFDGTASIVQPLIAPLYAGRSVYELIGVVIGDTNRTAYEMVRQYWRGRHTGRMFELSWEAALHDGMLVDTGFESKPVGPVNLGAVNLGAVNLGTANLGAANLGAANLANGAIATTQPSIAPAARGAALQVVFRLDPTVGDGAWANNAWLQELHKPITKLTWDNAVLLSANTARQLGLENEDTVKLTSVAGGVATGAPVWIVPGQPDNVATVHLGYGRWRAGVVGSGRGFNGYVLRGSGRTWFEGVRITPEHRRGRLATTQHTQLMNGRDLVRVRDLSKLHEARAGHAHAAAMSAAAPHAGANGASDGATNGAAASAAHGESTAGFRRTPLNLYAEWDYSKGNAWGMVIDQTACIGCNACVIACQSENNIPVVGKEQVERGRQMQWLRVDTYFASSSHDEQEAAANPETYFQPVPCMHCENAPCELVCPVGATTHDVEGTNNMVYNRCVGTRYCSNNCPYKVRRFNYLDFGNSTYQGPAEQLALLHNPDVTVRSRGVMEKCSYCIQRINAARIEAKKSPDTPNGFVRDGEVLTACQQTCPTDAIVFGNLNDPTARVTKLKAEPTNYGLLEELNTQPRTTYLERIRNPNPAIV